MNGGCIYYDYSCPECKTMGRYVCVSYVDFGIDIFACKICNHPWIDDKSYEHLKKLVGRKNNV